MEFMIDFDSSMKNKIFMDMSNIWIYNLDKSAFKSKYADTMNSNVIKELLDTLKASSLSDLAIFVPPWESSPMPRGVKYDNLWNELRQGRKENEKLIAGTRIIKCKHYSTPYAMVFMPAAALNPGFVAFVKGTQPSL